jgi:NADPH-dependent ferric siderophore reductase
MPGFFDDTAAPAIAVMIGEATKNAMSAAIAVRSGDSDIPISRRRPTAMRSTVSTVKNANSGMFRTVTAATRLNGPRGRRP